MTYIRNLKLSTKLAAIVVGLCIPIVMLGTMTFRNAERQMSALDEQLRGAQIVAVSADLMAAIAEHRSTTSSILTGDSTNLAAVTAAQAQIDALFAEIREIEGEGSPLAAPWARLKSEWRTFDRAKNSDAHLVLVTGAKQSIVATADRHGLNIDSSSETAFLARIGVDWVPVLLEDVLWQRRAGSDLAKDTDKSFARRADVLRAAASSERTRSALENTVKSAVAALPDRTATLRTLAAQVDQSVRALNERSLAAGDDKSITIAAIRESADAAQRALAEFGDEAHAILSAQLETRIAKTRRAELLSGVAALLTTALALLLAVTVARLISRSLRHAVEVFHEIERGKLDNVVRVESTDELGALLNSLQGMQTKLCAQLETERSAAAANARIKVALDKVSSNVMLADTNGRIVYVNESAQRDFANAASDFRRDLPGFDASKMVGSTFDIFHKNPAHQRGVTAALRETHVGTVAIGGRTFRITANPVTNDAGERLGTVVEWLDRTQEVATQKELESVTTAALAGDLTVRVSTIGKTGFFERMAGGLNGVLQLMSDIVGRIKLAARDVSTSSDEIARGNIDLSQRTEEAASSLEETASSMEQMTSTVKQNADNAGMANQLAMAARGKAETGGEIVGSAVRAMSEINASSKRIADIIGTIDEIAFQTNLLALNAAVEAARAGEQGRGFAVVASEVRSLAGRSAAAAKEIKTLIQDSVRKVEDGTQLVGDSGRTLEELVGAVKKVSDIVAEISAASNEQAAGIEQVNRAVTQMDEMTQQNAALVEEASAASQAIVDRASQLRDLVSGYVTSNQDEPGAAIDMSAAPEQQAIRARPVKAAKPGAKAMRPTPLRKVVGGSAQDWSEF